MVHRILGRRAAPALVLACTVLATSSSWAFCRTTTCGVQNPPSYCVRDPISRCWLIGAPLFWEQGCVSFAVQWNGSPKLGLSFLEAEQIALEAFAHWPSATCTSDLFDFVNYPTISISSAGPTWCTHKEFNPSGPNSNAIVFVDDDWSGDPSALALTTVSFNAKTGRMFGADLEVNTALHSFNRVQLTYVLTHEAGHFLGIDHSDVPEAVMEANYSLTSDAPPVALQPDDIQAICTAYPPSRTTPVCNPEPENGFAAECGGDVEAGCSLAQRAPRGSPLAWAIVGLGLALGRRARARARQRG